MSNKTAQASTNTNDETINSLLLNFIGGGSLGALIGLLLGLSATPVVASTLTVLLGAATVFLALHDTVPSGRAKEMSKALISRIIGFSLVAIVALLCGLHLRVNDTFGDSPHQRLYQDLVNIGVSAEQAKKVILKRIETQPIDTKTETERLVRSTALFSSDANPNSCMEMQPGEAESVESILARYEFEDGVWKDIASIIEIALQQDESIDGAGFAFALHTVLCAGVSK